VPACVWCLFGMPCRVTWSIDGGDEFGYENAITTHFASAERRGRLTNEWSRRALARGRARLIRNVSWTETGQVPTVAIAEENQGES
jgi:hypothetical protein